QLRSRAATPAVSGPRLALSLRAVSRIGPPCCWTKPAFGLLLRLLDTPDIRPQAGGQAQAATSKSVPGRATELPDQRQAPGHGRPAQSGHSPGLAWFKEGHPASAGASTTPWRPCARRFGLFWRRSGGRNSLNEFMLAQGSLGLGSFLSLLENMSYKCPDNQQHLVAPCQPLLLRLMRLCSANRTAAPTAAACLLSGLQLLINLSHDNARAAELLSTGSGGADLLETIANLALDCGEDDGAESPGFDFDLTLLSLGVLINLAEHSDENQRRVSRLIAGLIDRLAELFNVRFLRACSHELEEHLPDGSGAGGGSGSGGPDGRTERNGDEDETSSRGGDAFHSALSRAGEHMEDSVVAAYAGLLLCCLAQRDIRLAALIRTRLKPQPSFVPVLSCVTKFLSFLTLAASAGNQEERQKSHEEAESIARLLKARCLG
uniref:WAPL domain-containing protein n=1 Tax=Macrostomum lignano TaxID=282301 RepID=A0A1I8FLA5_9PLAT